MKIHNSLSWITFLIRYIKLGDAHVVDVSDALSKRTVSVFDCFYIFLVWLESFCDSDVRLRKAWGWCFRE